MDTLQVSEHKTPPSLDSEKVCTQASMPLMAKKQYLSLRPSQSLMISISSSSLAAEVEVLVLYSLT